MALARRAGNPGKRYSRFVPVAPLHTHDADSTQLDCGGRSDRNSLAEYAEPAEVRTGSA